MAESASLAELVGAETVIDEDGEPRTVFGSEGFSEAWEALDTDRKRHCPQARQQLTLAPGRGRDRLALYPNLLVSREQFELDQA